MSEVTSLAESYKLRLSEDKQRRIPAIPPSAFISEVRANVRAQFGAVLLAPAPHGETPEDAEQGVRSALGQCGSMLNVFDAPGVEDALQVEFQAHFGRDSASPGGQARIVAFAISWPPELPVRELEAHLANNRGVGSPWRERVESAFHSTGQISLLGMEPIRPGQHRSNASIIGGAMLRARAFCAAHGLGTFAPESQAQMVAPRLPVASGVETGVFSVPPVEHTAIIP